MDPALVPLGSLLEQLVQRHPALRQRQTGTLLLTSSPLYAKRPALAAFPVERVTHLLCATCRGWGTTAAGHPAEELACARCRGTGLCCPTCRGAHWVLQGARAGQRTLAHCPTCPTPVAEQAAILAYLTDGGMGDGE